MKKVLTIAGSDPSGGAGIQADVKTIAAHGVYAMSVITALTAQNTIGVFGIMYVPPEFIYKQLDSVFTDIEPDAVKIGMLPSAEAIHAVSERLKYYGARHVVVDPVMVSTSGSKLMKEGALAALTEELFPLAEVITPNIPEAEVLIKELNLNTNNFKNFRELGRNMALPKGSPTKETLDIEQTARELSEAYGCAVLIKGGHGSESADDYLYLRNSETDSQQIQDEINPDSTYKIEYNNNMREFLNQNHRSRDILSQSTKNRENNGKNNSTILQSIPTDQVLNESIYNKIEVITQGIWFRSERIDNPNTHGTGCTLSSAIAVNLALGANLPKAVQKAKDYVTGALNAGLNLGNGSGPLDHMYVKGTSKNWVMLGDEKFFQNSMCENSQNTGDI